MKTPNRQFGEWVAEQICSVQPMSAGLEALRTLDELLASAGKDAAIVIGTRRSVMKAEDVDRDALSQGSYCRKGVPHCFCRVGFPYEYQCVDCRDSWPEGASRDSYCICPPPERHDTGE